MNRSIDKESLPQLEEQQQKMARILKQVEEVSCQQVVEPSVWKPCADVVVDGEALMILIDLPGVDQDQIRLQLDQGVLIVEGERGGLVDEMACQRLECPRGRFMRRFLLPSTVSQDQLSAQCERGVLQVRISGLCADDQVLLPR